MSRLTWGAPTERLFETGVDRGVLYVGAADGVAWNGLVSVSESPTGGDAKPAYLDGVKFRNISASEEFEATLEAFAAPKEFGPCDGTQSLQKGLFATQQPRRAFSMTYRTKVGNAVDGEVGYKIHLVYNALAAPSQRNNATLSDSQSLNSLSWNLTTLPPSLTGFKPTAHFVIDSLTTPRLLLATIEDMLYGTDAAAARMPLASELVALFQSMGPVLYRNSLMNPSWRKTTGTVEVRRNLSYPSGWTPSVATGMTWGAPVVVAAAGATPAYSRATVATGPATAVGGGFTFSSPGTSALPIVAGAPYAIRPMFRTSMAGGTFYALIRYYNDSAVQIGGNTQAGAGVTVAADTWTELPIPSGVAPAGATRGFVTIYQTAGPLWQVGNTIDAYSLIEQADAKLDFFNGSSAAADGLTYSWTAAVNASPSIATGPTWAKSPFSAYSGTPGSVSWRATAASHRLLLKRAVAAGGILAFQSPSGVAAVPGQYWAARTRVRQAVTMGPVSLRVTLSAYTNLLNHNGFMTEQNIVVPEDGSWVDIELPSSAITPANTVYVNWLIYALTSVATGTQLEFEKAMVQLVADTGVSPSPYVDGAIPDADWNYYEWEGVADDSSSVLRSWN